MTNPGFEANGASQTPTGWGEWSSAAHLDASFSEAGGHTGSFRGAQGPASTFTPVELWDVRLSKGGELEAELPAGHTAGVFVLEGRVSVNGSREIGDAEMAVLDQDGEGVTIRASADTKLLVLGGKPLGEPVVSHGPFVMNSGEEIYAAIKDYQTGRMGHLS